MPLELPTEFDLLYERWRYRDTDFKNEKLNLLKYDIINNLYDYFSYWGFLMSYDAYSGYCLYKKPVYKGSEKARKAHLKKAIFLEKHLLICTKSYVNLLLMLICQRNKKTELSI